MDSRGLKMVLFSLVVLSTLMMRLQSSYAETGNEMQSSFAEVVPSDIWLINDTLKLPVEQTYPKTFLVSLDDGTVQAWRKTSDAAIWSFESGGPLVSFTWFASASPPVEEEDDEEGDVEMDPEQWYVEAPEVSFEEDGTLTVRDALNTKRTLNITLEEMRQGSVHVRIGELIQVDRQSTVFMVDVETGAIVQQVGTFSQDTFNFETQTKTLFLIRTDYVARASNLSGTLLWSLSYGEFGTLVTGLQNSTKDVASLSLLPKMSTLSPGVPHRIVPSLNHPAAVITGQRLQSETVKPSLPAGAQRPALPYVSAPAPSPSKSTISLWTDGELPVRPSFFNQAPGMLPPPKPASKIVAIYTSVAGLMIMAILAIVVKLSISTKISPAPPPIAPLKKKKPRRNSPSQSESANSPPRQESLALVQGSKDHLLDIYGSGTLVGRLFVSDVLIGSGSNGTLVLEGYLDDRRVAVKRLLAHRYEQAQKEIAHLIASDEHPNVVRYYAMERTTDFVFVSLERCSFSLYDLILAQTSQGQGMETVVKECLAGKGLKLRSVEDFKLWDEGGRPSAQLFQIMRDVVAGLAHLHALGIVHRDLKPHNVLISSGRIMQAKIADMGLSKQLADDALSFDNMTGHGSSGSRGWQAPEQLLNGRGSRAMDIFSLGCVLYYCITGGKHPFGSLLERDGNIARGKMDLFHIVDNPEATDLIERLLDPDPFRRPPANDILFHPFFWDAEKSLTFLKDASDRVELDMKECTLGLLADVESLEPSVLCGGWDGKLEPSLLQNIRGYRKYNFKSTRDLLRVIRNKAGHFREMPEHLQLLLGPVPDGLYEYFRCRFPRLLIEIYQAIGYRCKTDPSFEKYFAASYIPKFVPPQWI